MRAAHKSNRTGMGLQRSTPILLLSRGLCVGGLMLAACFDSWAAQPLSVAAWGADTYGQGKVPGDLTNIVSAVAGYQHNLALRADGTVVGWGYNGQGQLNVPSGLSGVVAVSASQQSMALKSDGTVVVWGHNSATVTNVPVGLTNVTRIAAGYGYNLAVKADGTVAAWGASTSATNLPAGAAQVTAVAAGGYHGLALKGDGTVIAWGYNFHGQTNVPVGLANVTAVAACGDLSLALKGDGTVVAWGDNGYGQASVPPGLNGVVAIATSGLHVLAAKNDGTVVAWGYNGNGQTNVPPGLSSVVRVSAGTYHSLALATIPDVSIVPQNLLTNVGATVTFTASTTCGAPSGYQWRKNGTNLPGATNATLILSNTQSSDAASYAVTVNCGQTSATSATATLAFAPPPTIVAQPQDATAYAGDNAFFRVSASSLLPITYQWLKNGTNSIGPNSPIMILPPVRASDAGSYAVVVTSAAGSVTGAPASLSFLGNRPAGSVVSLAGPTVPNGLSNVVGVAAGATHCLALRSNGTVVAWGGGFFSSATSVPAGLSNVVAVSAGSDVSVALRADGTALQWGQGGPSTFGPGLVAVAMSQPSFIVGLNSDGTVTYWGSGSPPAGSNFVAISAGDSLSFSAALRNDGTVALFGPPGAGAGFTSPSNIIAVAAASGQLLMLKSDGTLLRHAGGATPPAGLSNVVAIAAGLDYPQHDLALRSDGTVVGWGSMGVPAGLTNVTAISAGENFSLLLLNLAPTMTTQPSGLTVNGGENATFTVAAAGAPPLSYQWQKDGTNLAGATTATLNLTNAQAADAGSYTVIVSNDSGSVTSLPATLSVVLFPGMVVAPRAETVFPGALVTFTVSANGAGPLSYQWLKNGLSLTDATNQNLTLTGVQSADAGDYQVTVCNSYGCVTSSPVALTVSTHVFTFPPPGTVVSLNGPVPPPDLTNVVAIAAGDRHCLALRSNGTVVAWGGSVFPEVTHVPAGLTNAVAVAAGDDSSLAIKSDGTVVAWGQHASVPAGLFGVVAVAQGESCSMALKSDGTIVYWGSSGTPPAGSNFVAISAGSSVTYSVALKNDGTVALFGPPGADAGFTSPTNVIAVSAGGFQSLMLRNDGTVLRIGGSSLPAGLTNMVAIAAGPENPPHHLALRGDGTVVGWGSMAVPDGLTNVTAISAGYGYSLLLTTNPPPPRLAAASDGATFILSSPVAVPGYVLEATDDLSLPYSVVAEYTNNASGASTLSLPISGPKKYYRLRKQ